MFGCFYSVHNYASLLDARAYAKAISKTNYVYGLLHKKRAGSKSKRVEPKFVYFNVVLQNKLVNNLFSKTIRVFYSVYYKQIQY